MSNFKQISPTFFGVLATFFWAAAACFISFLNQIPVYQILSIVFFIGMIFCGFVNSIFGIWNKILSHPKIILCFGGVAFVGNDIFYVMAFKYASPIHIDIIVCLWPIFSLLFGVIFLKDKIRIINIICCFLCIVGVFILLHDQMNLNLLNDFNDNYLLGYLLAFGCVICWSSYVVMSRNYELFSPELFFVYCFIGFVISFGVHNMYEISVMPNLKEMMILGVMGVTTHGLAYLTWDFGVKKGNFQFLILFSYAEPVISVFCLLFLFDL